VLEIFDEEDMREAGRGRLNRILYANKSAYQSSSRAEAAERNSTTSLPELQLTGRRRGWTCFNLAITLLRAER
jgi:hypothetical protein